MDAPRDNNFIPTALFEIDGEPGEVMPGQINQATGRILVDAVSAVSSSMQKDVFVATSGQTVFDASKTVAFDFYLSVQGIIQTPTTDYTLAGNVVTLTAGSYPNGVPANTEIIFLYSTS
jgi:hypothetical protein